MPRTLCFRGLILIFVLTFVAPSAFAAGPVEPEGPSLRGILSILWEAIVEMTGSGTTSSAEGDSRGTMDPNG